jgi:hypothetical protein
MKYTNLPPNQENGTSVEENLRYKITENNIITGFNKIPLDYWINSFGGCRSIFIRNLLKQKYKIENTVWMDKACHYIRPLKVDTKAGIFCFVDDVRVALQSQINRKFKNYYKLRPANNKKPYTLRNWDIKIEKL